ncbi:MAG: branched-chain amino acid ABC transporter permease [Clostridia bacterium]
MKDKMKKIKWKHFTNYIIVGLALVVFLIIDASGALSRGTNSILITVGINIILAVSLNLVVGFLGELSLGHAGFMCIGAFVGKFASMQMAALPVFVSFPIAIIVGGLTAAFFGFLIGLPTMRLRGDYLAIVTLAFGEIARNVILNLDFFGGAAGLKGDTNVTTYWLCFIFILITLFVIQNLVRSRHGRAIRAIKNNDIAARSIGINVTYYKLMVFIISAFFAGIAGVLYSHNLYVLKSSAFSYNKSIDILVFVVLGGMGSITGSIIAATVLTVIPEMLSFLSEYRMLIYSVVLIGMMVANASPKFNEFTTKVKDKIKKFVSDLFNKIKKAFSKKPKVGNGGIDK